MHKKWPWIAHVNGKTFVLVPASEYRALIRRATASDASVLPKPRPQANGNFDAITTMRAIIARDLIRDRQKAKLSCCRKGPRDKMVP